MLFIKLVSTSLTGEKNPLGQRGAQKVPEGFCPSLTFMQAAVERHVAPRMALTPPSGAPGPRVKAWVPPAHLVVPTLPSSDRGRG